MIEASRESVGNPESPALRHLVADAVDPGRGHALRDAFTHLRAVGENPYLHDVRTATIGETVTGGLFGQGAEAVSLATRDGIVAVPKADISPAQLARDDEITVTVRSGFAAPPSERSTSRAAEADPSGQAQAYWQREAESGAAIRHAERQARAGEGQDAEEGPADRAGRYRAR